MYQKDLFKNKIAIVSGGRSGIGYAIAKQMLLLGAKVVICSRKIEPLQKAAAELAEFGDIDFQPCDIRKTGEIKELANKVKEKYGRLDILVNNAGGQFPALSENISENGWLAVINNNLNGTFFMIREMATSFFIPQKQGNIVNIIANINAGFPGMVHTGAARAGVENMTKTLAQEWSEHHIRVNCVAPGLIASSGMEQYTPEVKATLDKTVQSLPMKRYGTVEEVSDAVCFLASPLSSYISGISLYVDGAQHLDYDRMGLINGIKSKI